MLYEPLNGSEIHGNEFSGDSTEGLTGWVVSQGKDITPQITGA